MKQTKIDTLLMTQTSNSQLAQTEVHSQNTYNEINRAYGLIRIPRWMVIVFSRRLIDAASPPTISIDKKKISSGTQGTKGEE